MPVSRRFVSFCLLAFVVAAWPIAAVAQPQPVTRVYRGDLRPPAEVFLHGLQGRGSRLDLLAHTLGGSCEASDPALASAWVSTSRDRNEALGFVTAHLEDINASGPWHTMWIYTIRPDSLYTDVVGLLEHVAAEAEAGRSGYAPEHARTLRHLLFTTVIRTEEEVVTHFVAPENILSAVPVHLNATGDPVEGEPVVNSAYRALDTAVERTFGNLQALVPAASIRVDANHDSDTEGSCAMSCDSAQGESTFRMKREAPQRHCTARARPTPLQLYLSLMPD